jgi:hypothetical protein
MRRQYVPGSTTQRINADHPTPEYNRLREERAVLETTKNEILKGERPEGFVGGRAVRGEARPGAVRRRTGAATIRRGPVVRRTGAVSRR